MKKVFFYLLTLFGISNSILLLPNSTYQDFFLCRQEKEVSKCKEIKLGSKDRQCCAVKNIIDSGNLEEDCSTMVNPISEAQQYMKSEKAKAIYDEIALYSIFSEDDSPETFKQDITYNCNDGELNVKTDSKDLTEEDIKLIKSDEHCLKFGYERDSEIEVNEDKCFSLKLIKKSTNLGITCGYYELNLTLNNGTTRAYNYCWLFDKDIYRSKKLTWVDKTNFDTMVITESMKDIDNVVANYTAHFTGDKNRTMIYYSSNDSVIYEGPDDINPSNAAKSLNFRCLFVFVLLFI